MMSTRFSSTSTNNAQSEYLVLLFSYTTAQIEESRFSGDTPNPLYFVMPQPPIEVSPMVLTVIDGEVRVVEDESPPGAELPNLASGLFDLADAPTLMA
jgi:hypothetical protein